FRSWLAWWPLRYGLSSRPNGRAAAPGGAPGAAGAATAAAHPARRTTPAPEPESEITAAACALCAGRRCLRLSGNSLLPQPDRCNIILAFREKIDWFCVPSAAKAEREPGGGVKAVINELNIKYFLCLAETL